MTSTTDIKRLFLKRFQRFDGVVLAAILLLSLLIAIVLWQGDRTSLRVTQFSWEGKKVGVQDQIFTLSFNRPVAPESVEKNLALTPPLAGKISWEGLNLVYTLKELPIYGINYQIKLQNAQAAYGKQVIEPFVSLWSTRDRVLAYIGVERGQRQAQERGRLIIYNLTQKKKTILTPADLVVTRFRIYPQGDKILFLAFDPSTPGAGYSKQYLYTVTTGLTVQASETGQRAGKIQRLLEGEDYENLDFDLSRNGKTIVVFRTNRKNSAESGLWVIPEQGEPRPLGVPGGDFMVSPDGQRVAVAQRGGVRIIPLSAEAGATQFLSGYEKGLEFSRDGKKLLLMKNNFDFTRSLALLNANGIPQILFTTLNPIIGCRFEPREEKTLYCLKTDLLQASDGQYREEPFLSVIDLKTAKDLPLLALPNYRDVQLSMSPDGMDLLFDQIVTTPPRSANDLMTAGRQAIADGRIWVLPLPDIKMGKGTLEILPEELTSGFQPQWLP